MEKNVIITLAVVSVVILIVGGFLFFKPNTNVDENNVAEIENSCPIYDDNQEQCLEHSECKWVSGENICNSIGSANGEGDGDSGINLELEAIEIPDTPSNELCKKIPFSNQSSYGERYYCLAIINNDERFCEGIDEDNEKLMCLALAKENSSYCKTLDDAPKHVCYYQLAVSSNNADFCGDIDYSQNEKEQCYFNFMSNLYSWGKSDEIKTEYCDELGTPDKYTCLALKAKDVSLCGDNPNCLTFFIQDISFCDENPEIDSCIKDRAKTERNVSICELLTQPERDNCVGTYCTHTELKVEICDTIEGIMEKQDRYLELAMNLKNLS